MSNYDSVPFNPTASAKMQEGSARAMKTLFTPTTSIYFDIAILKDVRLGHLLSQVSEEDRSYVAENIESYNRELGIHSTYTDAFPKLAHLEQQLQDTATQYSDEDINYAPDTIVFLKLGAILKECHECNNKTNFHDSIAITINVYPYKITPLLQEYADILQVAFRGLATFKFISQDTLEIPTKTWDKFSIIYVYDIAKLCSNENTPWKEPINEGKWIQKRVYAPAYISPEAVTHYTSSEDIDTTNWEEHCLEYTEAALNCCFVFEFIHLTIMTED